MPNVCSSQQHTSGGFPWQKPHCWEDIGERWSSRMSLMCLSTWCGISFTINIVMSPGALKFHWWNLQFCGKSAYKNELLKLIVLFYSGKPETAPTPKMTLEAGWSSGLMRHRIMVLKALSPPSILKLLFSWVEYQLCSVDLHITLLSPQTVLFAHHNVTIDLNSLVCHCFKELFCIYRPHIM